MSSPVSLCGAGNQSTSASSMTSPFSGSRTCASAAWRGCGTRPISFSSAARACGPQIRTTAIAAGGRPEERAKMVGRSGAFGGTPDSTNAGWSKALPLATVTSGRRRAPAAPPRSVALPFAGHDAAERHDLIDNLGKAVMGNLAAHRRGDLVRAWQLGDIVNAAEEAHVQTPGLLRHQLAFGFPGVAPEIGRAAQIAAGAMRRKAEPIVGVASARDQDRLGHVERDQGQPAAVGRKVGPR